MLGCRRRRQRVRATKLETSGALQRQQQTARILRKAKHPLPDQRCNVPLHRAKMSMTTIVDEVTCSIEVGVLSASKRADRRTHINEEKG